jgi:hypothetical protein
VAAKKLVLIIVAALGVALTVGTVAVGLEWWSGSGTSDARDETGVYCPVPPSDDGSLQRTGGGVTLVLDPAEVKMEPAHEIRFWVQIGNSGTEPLSAWALDLGKGLYLVEARPKELLYHKGHSKGPHGNVLIYGIPIEPGSSLEIDLTVRVLFDSDGNFDPNPGFRLSYARSARDAQALAVRDLQGFRDTFVSFPYAEAKIHIER